MVDLIVALRLGMTAWLAWMTIKTVRRLLWSLRLARMKRLLPPICVAMDLDVIEANYEFCGFRCGSGRYNSCSVSTGCNGCVVVIQHYNILSNTIFNFGDDY